MRFEKFSKKQMKVMNWWCRSSEERDYSAIICDGAVRSGKTLSMSVSFVVWSFEHPGQGEFAFCGKTIVSLRRNLVTPLLTAARQMGYHGELKVSQNLLEFTRAGRVLRYHLFGGKDESSAALIQGMTLSGVFFDEVALMPRSFVEQAVARCSVEGSKFWFNCNPEHPSHWFYLEWIQKCREKNAFYIHFTMEDNPSLSPAILARYEKLYTGVFYERYVKGEWVAAHGAVYPMFSAEQHVVSSIPRCGRYLISCDYGTVNPASFGLWGQGEDGVWYRLREYYHDSRRTGFQRTDEEYCDSLEALAGDLEIEAVLVDPSAASFIQCLRRRGKYPVRGAPNDVAAGISLVAGALSRNKIRFHESCRDSIREFSLYRWNLEAGRDAPVKENDHAMDDIRYFAAHIFGGGDIGFFAIALERSA